MHVWAHGDSDAGRVRRTNEDRFLVRCPGPDEVGVFAVADGVGSRKHGEVASQMFVDGISQRVDEVLDRFRGYRVQHDAEQRGELLRLLAGLVSETGRAIFDRAEQQRELRGMCTTGLVMVVADRGAFLAHVGDSRAYMVRGSSAYQLTEDHTVLNHYRRNGMDGNDSSLDALRHMLTRALGSAPYVEADTMYVGLESGDRFLLCSDGLHNHVELSELPDLSAAPAGDGLARRLIAMANERGGRDNITAVVVGVSDPTAPAQLLEFRDRLELLRGVFFLRDLDDQELMRVMRVVSGLERNAGEIIIGEGAEANELYIMVDGKVDVTLDGRLLTSIGPGGHFGELALIDDQARSATVTARTPVTLFTIVRDDFNRLLRDDHALAVKLQASFLRTLAGRVRDLSVGVKDLARELSSVRPAAP